jgi:branched-chain amino acid transport system permease protein
VTGVPEPRHQPRAFDKQLEVYRRWDAGQRARLRPLITDELVEEHRTNPLGAHSDPLQRVLHYFRRQPVPGKYVAVMTKPWSEYKIGTLSEGRRGAPRIIEDETYPTEEAVLHGIFLRRLRDLVEE